jgi:hypothetical protein
MRLILVLALAASALIAVPATASAAPPMDCTGTLTGGTVGTLVVPENATCTLEGVTVTGSITVQEGATLLTDDSNIEMGVRANGAASVQLIDTNILGNIGIQRTTGLVLLGSDGCAVDPLAAGNVHLFDNSGPIGICFMTIEKNLQLQRNTNRIGVFDSVVRQNLLLQGNTGRAIRIYDTVVEQNLNAINNVQSLALKLGRDTIGHNLNCQNNGPLVLFGNTVGGQRIGDC